MDFAKFLFLGSEFAAIQFCVGRLEIVDEIKGLADVVEVGHVDDDFRGDAILRDEERTAGLRVAAEAFGHGLAERGERHQYMRNSADGVLSADGSTESTEISRRYGDCHGECASRKTTAISS